MAIHNTGCNSYRTRPSSSASASSPASGRLPQRAALENRNLQLKPQVVGIVAGFAGTLVFILNKQPKTQTTCTDWVTVRLPKPPYLPLQGAWLFISASISSFTVLKASLPFCVISCGCNKTDPAPGAAQCVRTTGRTRSSGGVLGII